MKRALSLDVLRGLSIFGMIFSATIPFGDALPAWMYHAQCPPPSHAFNPELPGITWVDLVLPVFIFCMGAAIPLALNRKISSGVSTGQVLKGIVSRFLLLCSFAIYIAHLMPNAIGKGFWDFQLFGVDIAGYDLQLLTLIGFALMFPMFMVIKDRKKERKARLWGWSGAILLLLFFHLAYNQEFSLHRSNIIILLLGNVYLFGALGWYFTRESQNARLILFIFWGAIQLCCKYTHFDAPLNEFKPLSWIFLFRMTHYMLLLIPATMVGDMLLKRLQNGDSDRKLIGNSRYEHIFFPVLAVIVGWLVVSLFSRWTTAAYLLTPVALAALYPIVKKHIPGYLPLFQLAAGLIVLGLILEPVEGGIKKDRATASYMVMTSGMAACLLMFFDYVCHYLSENRFIKLFAGAGSNPLMAYVGTSWLAFPLLKVSFLYGIFLWLYPEGYPWIGVLRAAVLTLSILWVVKVLTDRKIAWRA